MTDTVTLERDVMLRLLRRMPLAEGIVSLLELSGGEVTISEVLDALECPLKTLANTLAILNRAGRVTQVGSRLCQMSDQPRAEVSPDPSQLQPAIETELGTTLAQHQPEVSPTSGKPVQDGRDSIPSRARASEYLGVSSSSVDLEDLKPKPTPRSKLTTSTAIQKTKSPVAPRAVSSWQALLEKPNFHAPPWLDLDAWLTWLSDLQERKISVTQGALRVQLDKLKTLTDAGLEQQAVVDTAISRGWKTVGELDWFKPSTQSPGAARAGKPSLRAEDQFERLVREMGLTDAPPTITAQARAALPRGEN